MNITIHHNTTYFYEHFSKKSIQLIRMTPQNLAHQRVIFWQLNLPNTSSRGFDGFNNVCNLLTLQQPHQELSVLAQGEVNIANGTAYQIDDSLPALLYLRQTDLTEPDAAILAFCQGLQAASVTDLQGLSAAILQHMPYQTGITHVGSSAAEAFALQAGVCQDHTHVFLSCCRVLGVPARYVSGYIYTNSTDHLASHAWAEAHVDGKWYVFDVSNQHYAIQGHAQLAVGRDYNDAAPIRGVRQGGGLERMEFTVHVSTIDQ